MLKNHAIATTVVKIGSLAFPILRRAYADSIEDYVDEKRKVLNDDSSSVTSYDIYDDRNQDYYDNENIVDNANGETIDTVSTDYNNSAEIDSNVRHNGKK